MGLTAKRGVVQRGAVRTTTVFKTALLAAMTIARVQAQDVYVLFGTKCCRTADGGSGDVIRYPDIVDAVACQVLCSASATCVAVEVNPSNGCELHQTAIIATGGNRKCDCYLRSNTNTQQPTPTPPTPPPPTPPLPPPPPTPPPPPPATSAACHFVANVELTAPIVAPQAPTADSDACGALCLANPSCRYFSYYWGQCFMKAAATLPIVVPHEGGSAVCVDVGDVPDDIFDPTNGPNGASCAHGAIVDATPFDSAFVCDCTATEFSGPNCDMAGTGSTTHACYLLPGANIVEQDILGKGHIAVPSAGACGALCEAAPDCLAFSYAWDHCYLKSGYAVTEASGGATSGICDPTYVAAPTAAVPAVFRLCEVDDVGFDYDGSDINGQASHIPTEDAAACAAICEENDLCQLFTWVYSHCYMKLTSLGRKSNPAAQSGSCRTCIGAPCTVTSAPTAPPTVETFKTCSANDPGGGYDGFDLGGGGTHIPLADAEACAGLCEDNMDCAVFTYAYGHCYLKLVEALASRTDSIAAISGSCETCVGAPCTTVAPPLPTVKECTVDDAGYEYFGQDTNGFGTNIAVVNASECAAVCEEDATCTHFTYIYALCYLKTGADGRRPAPDAVSGSCRTCVGECGSTAAPETPATPGPRTCDVWSSPSDIYGNNVVHGQNLAAVDVTACGVLCEANPLCSFFTYAYGACFLKSSDAGRYPSPNALSGECAHDSDDSGSGSGEVGKVCSPHDVGVAYHGNDIGGSASHIANSSPFGCAILCEEHPFCSAFAFTYAHCYLKTSDSGRVALEGSTAGTCQLSAAVETQPPGFCVHVMCAAELRSCNAIPQCAAENAPGDLVPTVAMLAGQNGLLFQAIADCAALKCGGPVELVSPTESAPDTPELLVLTAMVE